MTKKETTAEIRLEDLGKQLLANAEPIEFSIVLDKIKEYVQKTENQTYLLYSKEIGYFQLFYDKDNKGWEETANHIASFLEDSCFLTSFDGEDVEYVGFAQNVTFIEDEENVQGLSIWFKTTYFQLIPYDVGIEVVGNIQEG